MAKAKPEEKEDLAPFLRRMFLFSALSDERVARLADAFEVIPLLEGERAYEQGVVDNYFYFVFEGKLRLKTGKGKQERDWDTLIPGDYFGEDILLNPFHFDTAYALAYSRVLRLEKGVLLALLGDYPRIGEILRFTAESRQLVRREQMDWMGDNETVYGVFRKHEFFLMIKLLLPIFLGVAAIPFMVMSFASGSMPLIIASVFLALFAGGLAVWLWADWRNDYFIVTSQRVLWLEKVILLYDSRQEAPLGTIVSKDIFFNQILRRIINYGNVIVRTYTGSIVFRRIAKPDLVITYLDGLQTRVREITKKEEADKLEALIRERLRLSPRKVPAAPVPVVEEKPRPLPQRASPLEQFFGNVLKVRYEKGESITYRKHWIVLLQKTWLPLLVMFLIIFGLIFVGVNFPGTALVSPPFLIFLWVPVLVGVFLWGLYHYIDWRNDIYVVTTDTILDIDRKPLSREHKKSAPLANILSLEHTRVGILGLLFNYGTVIANIGADQFTFNDVYNPSQVQYEIFDRMYAQRLRKEEAEARKERERIVDSLSTYHRQIERLEEIENESDWDIFSG